MRNVTNQWSYGSIFWLLTSLSNMWSDRQWSQRLSTPVMFRVLRSDLYPELSGRLCAV